MNISYYDATDEFQRFRLLLRHTWNSYIWSDLDMRDWDSVSLFKPVQKAMAQNLLEAKIRHRLSLAETAGLTIIAVPCLIDQRFKRGAPVGISETNSNTGRYWNQPPEYITTDDMVLEFSDWYDCNPCDYRDLDQYLVVIKWSQRFPELVGREAIVDVSAVKIIALPGEATDDQVTACIEALFQAG